LVANLQGPSGIEQPHMDEDQHNFNIMPHAWLCSLASGEIKEKEGRIAERS